MTDIYPGEPEPPVGSIVCSRLDGWQWQRVEAAGGTMWQPVHLTGPWIIRQSWTRIGDYGPLELIRWGTTY